MWTSGGTRSRRLSSGEVLQEARESMGTYTSRISYIYLLLARHAPIPPPARAQPAMRPSSPGPFEPTSAWLSLSLSLSQAIDAVITSLADTMGVVQTQAETIAVLTAQLFKPYPYPYHQT